MKKLFLNSVKLSHGIKTKGCHSKGGFTLAELLVVVAILAILVAVSLPIFSGKLEAAKLATDAANVRSARAVAVNAMLNGEFVASDGTKIEIRTIDYHSNFYYCNDGTLARRQYPNHFTPTLPKNPCKALTSGDDGSDYYSANHKKNCYLVVTFFPEDDKYFVTWSTT